MKGEEESLREPCEILNDRKKKNIRQDKISKLLAPQQLGEENVSRSGKTG